jgi:uncharacterized membrane-anchored protein
MTVGWTRATLDTHVTVLSARHDGKEFVDAIAELAATLDDNEVVMLREILLQKAHDEGVYAQLLAQRIDAPREPRWRLFRRRPRD